MTDEPETCPYLGLPDDPRTRFTFATPAHRCHVKREPSPIGLGHQGTYCLSRDFPSCKRFRASAAPTMMVVASSAVRPRSAPGDTPPMTRTRRLSVRRRVLLLLVLLAAAVLIGAIVSGTMGAIATAPATPPTADGLAASPSPSAAPSPSSAPAPSPSPTALPSPSPTSTSSPGPIQTIYVVKPGDSLSSIAAKYGVTPQAIQQANKIKDPNVIQVGQKLIIPRPPQ
jgi:LysM repeat protein